MIKSRRMGLEGHVAKIREKRNACMILKGKAKRKQTTRKTKKHKCQ
jgi:hypothetical protein